MSYYGFNKCKEECLPQLEELASQLGLKKTYCVLPSINWNGDIFKRRKKFDKQALMVYDPRANSQLMFQTAPDVTHKQDDVKSVLQKLIEITGATEVNNLFIPYNLDEFR